MNPPVFYKGKNLRAQDLIDMEEYLLSISSIKDGGHGVIRLFPGDKKMTIKPGKAGLSSYLIIEDVIGITPSGRPIKYKTNPQTSPLAIFFSFESEDDKVIADIFLDDLHYTIESTNETELNNKRMDIVPQKYKLSWDNITEEDTAIDYLKNDGNSLYLGRYVVRPNKTPDMLQPPLPYYLSAIKFPSDWWEDWTRDIREAIRQTFDRHKENVLIIPFVVDIAYNFHKWPMNQLINACSIVDALSASAAIDAKNTLEDEFWVSKLQTKSFFELLAGRKTMEIPSIIIKLLGGGERKELLSKNAYSIQTNRLLIFSLDLSQVKFLKIEVPDAYSPKENKQGILYTIIRVNEFEQQFPEIIEEKDDFKGRRRYFQCEYTANGLSPFSVRLDYDWNSGLKIFKSTEAFKLPVP